MSNTALQSIGWQPVQALRDGDIVEVEEPNGSQRIRVAFKVEHRPHVGVTVLHTKTGTRTLPFDGDVEVFIEKEV